MENKDFDFSKLEDQERFMSLPTEEKDRLIDQAHTEANAEALEKRKHQLMQLLENILGKVPNSEEQKAENIKIEETEQKVEESLFHEMKKIFPKTFGDIDPRKTFPDISIEELYRYTEELYHIGSVLKGSILDGGNSFEELKSALQGKKVLIIGDDRGSLSEILKALGADAYGVEYSQINVDEAHSGKYSESRKPQMQVILGDAWDLANDQTELYKKIEQLGPFDLVYSHAVLNGGSGFTESLREKIHEKYRLMSIEERREKLKERDTGILKGFVGFYKGADNLLATNGTQLHDRMSDYGMPIPYHFSGSEERFKYEYADPNFVADIKKNIVAVFYDGSGSMALPKGSPARIEI